MIKYELEIVDGEQFRTVKPDITKLFIDTFSSAPRYEIWTTDEVSEYLNDAISFGFASACLNKDILVGFNIFYPIQYCHIKEDIIRFLGIEEGFYFSDAAVRASERGQGLGKRLLTLGLEQVFTQHSDLCVVRTRTDALAMRHILEKFGFTKAATYFSSINGSNSERVLYSLTAKNYFDKI